MSVQMEIIDLIQAAQAARKLAYGDGNSALSDSIFTVIVTPLNSLLSRHALAPKADDVERSEVHEILDKGLTALNDSEARPYLQPLIELSETLQISKIALQSALSINLASVAPSPVMDTPDPVPKGPPGLFIKARSTGKQTVVYIDAAGRDAVRRGGSRSWRNCNPGNIRAGSYANVHGAIGDDGSFAIFPDEATGEQALTSLFSAASYKDLSIEDALNRYAPPNENDTSAYISFVTSKTGLSSAAVIHTLTADQLGSLTDAIKAMEGWKPGDEQANQPASFLLSSTLQSGVSSGTGASKEWVAIAEQESRLAVHDRSQWPGAATNPRILNYFKVAASWFEPDGDETDWCAAFVNYCLLTSGHFGTEHPGARSFFWNKKNIFVRLEAPAKGCIAVRRYSPFDDPQWKEGPGHVGFVMGWTANDITLLGGNQNDTVSVKTFPRTVKDSQGKLNADFVAFLMPVVG